MSKPQRIVVVIFCLSLAYCFAWIPWSATSSDRYGTYTQRFGYGWVWAGPQNPEESMTIRWPEHSGGTAGTASFSDIREFSPRSEWDARSSYGRPDLPLIAFRLIVLTSIFVAVFMGLRIRSFEDPVSPR
jgi:hypothetical protein